MTKKIYSIDIHTFCSGISTFCTTFVRALQFQILNKEHRPYRLLANKTMF